MNSKNHIHVVPSLAEPVGKLWQKLQVEHTSDGYFNVASPLSSTPLPVYDWIVEHKSDFPHWEKVRFVLMDEMVEGSSTPFSYISQGDNASYERFARQHFIDRLDKNVPILKPNVIDMGDAPSIDLLILALGVHGNYANVMPNTSIETGWHIAHLSPEFRQTHTNRESKSYAGANFREYGMSLGPQQVLRAKHIAVIVSGQAKATLTEELLSFKDFDPAFPLSIVHDPSIKQRVQFYLTEDTLVTN
jgi:6-phosphogluconolactonase/glucosamine-6-phosphate isomerase/deaminase